MNPQKLIILGAGGLAREARWLLAEMGKAGQLIEFTGYIAPAGDSTPGDEIQPAGDDEWALATLDPSKVRFVNAIGEPKTRKRVSELYLSKGFKPMQVIHPSVIYPLETRIGMGCILFPGCVITADVRIGNFALLNPHVSISHDCKIGDYALIGPGARLAGNVTLGNLVTLGAGAVCIPGVVVEDEVFVGAGAVVIERMPAGALCYGVPAKAVLQPPR